MFKMKAISYRQSPDKFLAWLQFCKKEERKLEDPRGVVYALAAHDSTPPDGDIPVKVRNLRNMRNSDRKRVCGRLIILAPVV